jgi:hypothetical protein
MRAWRPSQLHHRSDAGSRVPSAFVPQRSSPLYLRALARRGRCYHRLGLLAQWLERPLREGRTRSCFDEGVTRVRLQGGPQAQPPYGADVTTGAARRPATARRSNPLAMQPARPNRIGRSRTASIRRPRRSAGAADGAAAAARTTANIDETANDLPKQYDGSVSSPPPRPRSCSSSTRRT